MPLPSFAERLREIVSLNSISSEEPELDQSNESVVHHQGKGEAAQV